MKMKKTAEDFPVSRVTEAVITVPAYFNDSQRQATRKRRHASRVSTSSAHQRADGRGARLRPRQGRRGSQDRRVRPAAAGTFDLSIIEIAEVDGERQFEVISTKRRHVPRR